MSEFEPQTVERHVDRPIDRSRHAEPAGGGMSTVTMVPRHTSRAEPAEDVLDVLGIGFGPSNVALAIALRESWPDCDALFLEAQETFGWHRSMLFDDAGMQISFLKDLVSFRNPRSEFTFLNFLYQQDRLVDFANLGTFFPSRVEFHQYLEWCAGHFDAQVRYGHRATAISTETVDGVEVFRVRALTPSGPRVFRSRAIVHAGGLEPITPIETGNSERIIHGYDILNHVGREDGRGRDAHYAVVGAGQSAAEIVRYLHRLGPETRVSAILSRYGYTPADDSPFVNQLFDPDLVDVFYDAPRTGRERMLQTHATTNYAAVDLSVIEEIYRDWYHDRVTGGHRLAFHRMSYLRAAEETPEGGLTLTIEDRLRGRTSTLEVDWLICATGFRARTPIELFSEDLRARLRRDGDGAPCVNRDYSLAIEGAPGLKIVSPHMCERTHGFTATLISNMAVRAGEIVDSLHAEAMPMPMARTQGA